MTKLNDRQIAITLAALRYMQQQLSISPMFAATHMEKDPIVTQEEIDEICEAINFD